MPVVIHGISKAELDRLAPVVGRYVDHFGNLDLVLPVWWHLLYVTATS